MEFTFWTVSKWRNRRNDSKQTGWWDSEWVRAKYASFGSAVSKGLCEEDIWAVNGAKSQLSQGSQAEETGRLEGPQQEWAWLVQETEKAVCLEVNEQKCLKDQISRSQIMQTFVGNDKEFCF